MPKIRCYYDDCIFLVKGLCNAPSVELDPEDGCLTYSDDPEDIDLVIDIFDEEGDDIDDYEDDDWESEGFEEINFDDEDYD